jgi:hypothetical protein
VAVPVVDIGQMLVLVGKGQVSMFGPGQHFDRTGAVVRIAWVDGVGVLHDGVNVAVSVMGGADNDHADERHHESSNGRERQSVTVDRPGEQCADEWR